MRRTEATPATDRVVVRLRDAIPCPTDDLVVGEIGSDQDLDECTDGLEVVNHGALGGAPFVGLIVEGPRQ